MKMIEFKRGQWINLEHIALIEAYTSTEGTHSIKIILVNGMIRSISHENIQHHINTITKLTKEKHG